MKQKIVGCYDLDFEQVRVILQWHNNGADCDTSPRGGSCAEIRVGANFTCLDYVFGLLKHEVDELLMVRHNHRYRISPHNSWGSQDFYFIFDHNAHSEMSIASGEFLCNIFDDFRKAWEEMKAAHSDKKIKNRRKARRQ